MAHCEKPIRFKLIIEGETMSTVTGTYTVSVAPGTTTPPLAITPAMGALPGETEGQAVSGVVATISGGVPPYADAVISGQPAGVTFTQGPSADGVDGDEDITIGGTPAAGDSTGGDGAGNYRVSISVTDSATPPAQAKLTAKVRKL
jgi:hypothetical protein